jgi:hypothetical protein
VLRKGQIDEIRWAAYHRTWLCLFMALQLGVYKTILQVSSSHPRDFHLFRTLKKNLAAKRFAADANVQQTLTSEFQTLNTEILFTNKCTLLLNT